MSKKDADANAMHVRLADELQRARTKFPGANCNMAALTEEVGELAQALLHIREHKPTASARNVWDEAVQVAVMAARVALEGDPTLTTEYEAPYGE